MSHLTESAIVAIATDTVKAKGIPESAVSPTNSNEMLYQIDGFHELHCLVCESMISLSDGFGQSNAR